MWYYNIHILRLSLRFSSPDLEVGRLAIKVLIADDDPAYRDLVSDIVSKQGYEPVLVADGNEALEALWSRNDIGLVILDVMMPGPDGWEVLKIIRERSDVPIIMLTALDDERHEIHGLREGANDYVSKPFSYELFVARINSSLRASLKKKSAIIDTGGILIEQDARKVSVEGRQIQLNRKEYDLLVYFLQNGRTVLSRDRLIDDVWGLDFEGDVRTVDTHVKTLRAKLGGHGKRIRTVRGCGYSMETESDKR